MTEMPAKPFDPWVRRHDHLLALLAGALCVTPQLKFAQVQLLELIYAFDIVIVTTWLLAQSPPIHIFRPFLRMAVHWSIFGLGCALVSALALNRDFYLSPGVGGINVPILVTVARLIELVLDVFAFTYLACRFREDAALCRFALRWYCAIGVAGCLWGAGGLVLGTLTGSIASDRMVGFNNEGGPFGVYLVTVMVGFVALRQKQWLSRRSFLVAMPLLTLSLVASKSKAAFIEIVVFAAVIAFLKMSPLRALTIAISVSLTMVVVLQGLGLSKLVLGYFNAAGQYAALSHVRQHDNNFVVGRVAGIFLTPRMIAAHPIVGIGLGNYPLVRDDPQYRQGSVIVEVPLDSPALGLVDYVVEIGIPLSLFLTWIEIAPAIAILRHQASVGTVALVLTMPISLWFGAHLNLTYPWIAAALGLGLFYSDHRADGRPLRKQEANLHAGGSPEPQGLPGKL